MNYLMHLNDMWCRTCEQYGDRTAFGVRYSDSERDENGKIHEVSYFKTYTYSEVEEMVSQVGAGLAAIGLKEGERVAIISENRLEWIIADLAVLGNRALDVPRGVSSTDSEIVFILNHSECRIAFVESESELKRLQALREELPNLEIIIVLSEEFTASEDSVYSFKEIKEKGCDPEMLNLFKERRAQTNPQDLATIIYTSGTTGEPKGIPLTHFNLIQNINAIPDMNGLNSEDRFLSILPIWHVFEREFEYLELSVGASIWYTSKLTLLKDMQEVQPTFMASVPRIWLAVYNGVIASLRNKGKEELFNKLFAHSLKVVRARRYKQDRQYNLIGTRHRACKASPMDHLFHFIADKLIYKKIRQKVGGAFRAGISGGASLPGYIDDFFEVIGVSLLEGYGLTETGPILTARTFDHLIPYTAGQPLPNTEFRILDSSGNEISDSEKGVIWVSAPQVMNGYYKNDEETSKVMSTDEQGRRWFNTGDIGRRLESGDISIIGRDKCTIVLLGGENIEPEPIEDKLLSSRYFDQVMVCGQDQENLTLLICPNEEALTEACSKEGITFDAKKLSELSGDERIRKIIMDEITALVSQENGFKEIEQIHDFRVVLPFSTDDDTLTQTFKTKRFNVTKRDFEKIKSMYPHFNRSRVD